MTDASMRRIRYAVATSLDGYIAGPKGEADWSIMDPEIAGWRRHAPSACLRSRYQPKRLGAIDREELS